MGIPDLLTCLLRNLYAGQEATVNGTADWFHIGKGAHQGCILSSCLFNLYSEYIMWNTGLDEAQAGINIAGRSINNLRYDATSDADDTTLMTESEEELKNLLRRVKKENEKAGLKLNIRKLGSWHPVPSFHGKFCCSVTQSCLTLCNPMDCSMSGFIHLHHLTELAQTHVHWVCDAIQPSHPLSSVSPPAFNLSQD